MRRILLEEMERITGAVIKYMAIGFRYTGCAGIVDRTQTHRSYFIPRDVHYMYFRPGSPRRLWRTLGKAPFRGHQ